MQAGEIGTLEQLTIISRDPAPPPAGYVATSGGLFRDMTIHDFDMARFFLGDVVEVSATGSNLVSAEIAEAGDIDGAVVVLRGAGGALCSITNSRRCAFGYDQRLEAFGERGSLSAANQLPDQRPVLGRRRTPRSRRRTTTSSSTGTRRPTGRRWTASSPRVETGSAPSPRVRRRPRRPGARRRGEREPADRGDREGGHRVTVRWEMLSTAGIGRVVASAIRGSTEAEFVAVAGRNAGKAAAYVAELGVPRSFGSYDELLACDQVDAVYVPLPIALHTEWTIKALRAGKHVLCEKPFATTAAAAAACFDAADAAGRLCIEGLMWRHHPQTALAQHLSPTARSVTSRSSARR